ncbi:mechanosensitive ion channel domain-containing protein [Succinivibrio dextrinosolvens]|uniref:Small-conductance mechanosensitive channel n=1 Tax=Succinivibrio dextrinosolvens TaxID=83771 RepID=A0A662ZA87_9GAMM|nr:mechanosensitive ion channel domain-containing protein [Succinivibrio dextrinosolvens]SFK19865.1 Small-conductance mechanosensitive channel [Succinivibrio dextrinosolvens]
MNKILSLLIIVLFSISTAIAQPQTTSHTNSVSTRFGQIKLPTTKELTAAITSTKDNSTLSEKDKEKLIATYTKAIEKNEEIPETKEKLAGLNKLFSTAKKRIVDYSRKIHEEKKKSVITDTELESMSYQEITEKLKTDTEALFQENISLERATQYHNDVQTLPEKSQSTVTFNNEQTKTLMSEIDSNPDTENMLNRAYAVIIYETNLENNLYKTQLSNISILQDISTLELEYSTLKYNRLNSEIKKLSNRIKVLDSNSENNESKLDNEAVNNNPLLKKIIKETEEVKSYLSQAKELYAEYKETNKEVRDANLKVSQIEKNLENQIKELNKSLILSRLLNKQLTSLPKVSPRYDVDEKIANINIYLYEIRERLTQISNVFEDVESAIKKYPELEPYREDVITIFGQRKTTVSEIYQVIADSLNENIEIKVNYASYKKIYDKISADIGEQLFWIKSNQPLGSEFLKLFVPTASYELESLKQKISNKDFLSDTTKTVTYLLIPYFLLCGIILIFIKRIKDNNNRLARRLDSATDSVFLTPLALLNNMILMIPSMGWMICLGAIIICISLGETQYQRSVITAMIMHIFVFVFFMQILKPNALVQRHFSVEPYKLAHYRNILSGVWTFALPLLIFANVAEADAVTIYSDLTSFTVVLLSCIGLFIISFRLLIKNLRDLNYTSAGYIVSCLIGILITSIATVAVSSGYLYTVVKLTNRIAYTFYIVLTYFLISQTVHRMIYVLTVKIYEKIYESKLDINSSDTDQKGNMIISLVSVMNLNAPSLCARVYKISRIILLVVTAILLYIQWSDLSSVLRYLDTVHIWSKTEIINGAHVVTDYLSIANILFAIFLLIITSFLNRTIPALFEKIILIKKDERFKSTSYSVKVISSYIIIGLGLISAAGALGIKWENLQWLVAALSVGLGFGLQEIFANFVSGIILLFERQLRVGDIITLNGLSGTVSKIRIRSTTVMSFENKEVMIPNREFITSALTNWSLTSSITKMEFNVGVAYGTNIEKAKGILRNIINRCRYIAKDQASLIYVKALASSEVTLACDIYVTKIGDRKLAIDYLSQETLNSFANAGIEIPFNQMDVHVKTLEQQEFIDQLKQGLFNRNAEQLNSSSSDLKTK